jgi:thioredoxin type arsenate reductase
MAAAERVKVLFLCTGNSCRSQMAEGWAKALRADRIEAHSAGTSPHGMNRLAVEAMREAGVDITSHHSKHPDELSHVTFDFVVTVCDAANESCPVFPGRATVVHAGFDDPPRLAKDAASDQEAMPHYRRVRDQIRAFIETLPDALQDARPTRKDPAMYASDQKTTHKNDTNASAGACCAPTCCGGSSKTSVAQTALDQTDQDRVRSSVRAGYSTIARAGSWTAAQSEKPASGCCTPSSGEAGGMCCGPTAFTPDQLAAAIGYSDDDLAATPESANMGLSCGNPTALAALRRGETVLDLGSGGGFDCFIAGKKVGASGRVIGVDMTPDMITKARSNTGAYAGQTGLTNVEFRLGEIEHLPVPDASVDVVLSNCVLNLSPDKAQVWKEIARVLKPGGRVAVSDLALLRPLPESVAADLEALVGCVAGAVLVEETERQMLDAGLAAITLKPKPGYIDSMSTWQDPLYRKIADALPAGTKPSDFVTSLDIAALKP